MVPRMPTKPTELTEDNFVYPEFGQLAQAFIGSENRFKKAAGGRSVYLQSLTPGTYRYYGPIISLGSNGIVGPCYCMGSVKFEVKAGQITDLGTVAAGTIVPFQDGMEIDDRIKDWPRETADLRAVGKIPNYFGITIMRIPPIPGVIAYQRDQIVDLKAAP